MDEHDLELKLQLEAVSADQDAAIDGGFRDLGAEEPDYEPHESPIWIATNSLKLYLKAIADPTRLGILHELARAGEHQVLELARLFGLSQPLASWHLRILRQADLIETQKLGRQVICRLNRPHLQRCRADFDALLDV